MLVPTPSPTQKLDKATRTQEIETQHLTGKGQQHQQKRHPHKIQHQLENPQNEETTESQKQFHLPQ